MKRFTAKVIKTSARSRYLPASYRVELYLDGKFIVDYNRVGRIPAYDLKHSYEATGVCSRS